MEEGLFGTFQRGKPPVDEAKPSHPELPVIEDHFAFHLRGLDLIPSTLLFSRDQMAYNRFQYLVGKT